MTAPAQAVQSAFEEKVKELIVRLLKLGDDVQLDPDSELIDQVGLDSIEAFDAVATLHELLGVSIPDDFDPRTVSTIRSLSRYVIGRFGSEAAERFLEVDLDELESMRGDEEL